MYNISNFIDGCHSLGINLSDHQVEQFLLYYDFLIEKNKVMNLTAITDFDEVVKLHFLDSLLLSSVFDLNKVASLVDMGTGAGFPGVPLKIVFPFLSVTLADSLNKRILFLDELTAKLGLEDIKTVHSRAEDLGRNPDYREKYDLAVSRAVASMSSLSEYCLPLVKKGGVFIAYKSEKIEEEYESAKRAISVLGGHGRDIEKNNLPGTDLIRSFIIVDKVKNSSMKYPRKAGIPKKSPL